MKAWRRAIAAWIGALALLPLGSALGQEPSRQPDSQPGRPAVTRADLAAAYMRLEQAIAAHPLQGEAVANVNRGFDEATLAFFAGRNAQAIQAIDGLTLGVLGQAGDSMQAALLPLRVRMFPAVYPLDRHPAASFRITSVYGIDPPPADPGQLVIEIIAPDGSVAASAAATAPGTENPVDGPVEFAIPADLKPGLHEVRLRAADGTVLAMGRWPLAPSSCDALREVNVVRLEAAAAAHPEVNDAAAICAARNQLLTDHPSQSSSSQFLNDPAALGKALAQEIAAIEAGRDPYVGASGDLWRVAYSGQVPLAMRLYVPPSLPKDAPAPVVIVLHGAGGDENMFMEAYGAGLIKKLADAGQFIVVSPQTNYFAMNIEHFDALMRDLEGRYSIDRTRVYVLGHSMGAAGAAGIARSRADQVAAACCISGVGGIGAGRIAPMLVIAAELDPLMPAARAKLMADRAVQDGQPVEFRVEAGYGHTLVVAHALPEAIDWLLKHRLPAVPPTSTTPDRPQTAPAVPSGSVVP